MAEELSPEPGYRLKEGLATWRDWVSGPLKLPVPVRQLRGASNVSFLVSDRVRYWVVRLLQPLPDQGVDFGTDPGSELSAMMAAAEEGFAPRVTFSSQQLLVTEFVSGHPPTLADLEQVGELFHRVHRLKAGVLPLDLNQHLAAYYRQTKGDPLIDLCFERVVELPVLSAEPCVCHQDLLFENMIKTGAGIYAIDWEYARLADPAYDLAVFAGNYNLDEGQRKRLLGGYQSRDTELRTRIAYFEVVYALIEILWWQLKGRRLDNKIAKLCQRLGIRVDQT
ncbi:MAG: choline/ethanolamine kinase family protein [bacterium]